MGDGGRNGKKLVTRRRSIYAIVMLAGMNARLVSAQGLKGTQRMDISLPQLVENIAAHLAEADVSVSSVSSILGPVSETYSGSGYYLAPVDKRLASVWVGIHADKSGGEVVSDLDLELRPRALKMAELDQKFGAHTKGPPAPSGPLYRVRYRYGRDDKPYTVTIFATLSGDPGPNSAAVEKIMLRRDKR